MLGAQARAAELQAAKSAALRQRAHREPEDHILLPPESAPVSLTEFARNPVLNKNKGVKAFRPLIDSDFEAKHSQVEIQGSISGTPPIDDASIFFPSTAPTAPRAMLNRSDSRLSRPTPSRANAPTFTPKSQIVSTSIRAMEQYDFPGDSPGTKPSQNVAGYVFGPDDLSPTKQELKFYDMHRQYNGYPVPQTPSHPLSTPFMPDARVFTPREHFGYEPHFRYEDMDSHAVAESYIYGRPQLHPYHSESDVLATNHFQDQTSVIQRHLERTQSFTEDLVDHHHQMQQTYQHDHSRLSQSVLNDNQPYDRNTKMQSFVAAQQAIAKKGKTVLHNPELYRSSREDSTSTPLSAASTKSVTTSHQSMAAPDLKTMAARLRSNERAAAYAWNEETDYATMSKHRITEPDLSSRQPEQRIDKNNKMTKDSDSQGVTPLPDNVMSSDWLDLRPVTIHEREIMRYNLRRFNVGCDFGTDLSTNPTAITGIRAQEWWTKGSVHTSTKQTAVLKIIEEYEKRRNHSSEYGAIGRPVFKSIPDLGSRGALKAIANIMATIYDRAEDYKKTPMNSPYTPAPSHAIDETIGSGSSLAATSLFDNLDVETSQNGQYVSRTRVSSYVAG